MKRRTFLQLAPFAVIGLTACGKSDSAEATNKSLSSASSSSGSSSMETNQIIDDMDEDYEESGLTLEEARYYSKTYNCAYFIRRADDGMFYPVAVPLVAIERSKKYTTDCVFLDSFSYKKYASMGSFQFSLRRETNSSISLKSLQRPTPWSCIRLRTRQKRFPLS